MTVYLAIGSNRPGARARLAALPAALAGIGVRAGRVSALLRNRPQGMSSRSPFLNGVIAAETDLPPGVLLLRLLRLEREFGRRRGGRGRRPLPRSLDLDLILYGRARIRRSRLQVPHPRFAQRGFVLRGLAEIAPGLRPAGQARTVRQLLRRLGAV